MKKITIEYEDVDSFNYDQELMKKGRSFEDFDEYLRACVKYDKCKEFFHELDLERKTRLPSLEDIVSETCRVLRIKLHDLNKE